MTPRIQPLREIGSNRAMCEETVRVAAGLVTRTAQYRAHEAERKGHPVNQCGKRGDFNADGRVLCRAHAAAYCLKRALVAQGPKEANDGTGN